MYGNTQYLPNHCHKSSPGQLTPPASNRTWQPDEISLQFLSVPYLRACNSCHYSSLSRAFARGNSKALHGIRLLVAQGTIGTIMLGSTWRVV